MRRVVVMGCVLGPPRVPVRAPAAAGDQRFVRSSMMIAMTMITPLTTCWAKGDTLRRSSPVFSDPRI
jgi:hypothetical protein